LPSVVAFAKRPAVESRNMLADQQVCHLQGAVVHVAPEGGSKVPAVAIAQHILQRPAAEQTMHELSTG
jgi:hypothetical protein